MGQQAIASADGTESHPENALGRLYHPDWKPQRFPPQALPRLRRLSAGSGCRARSAGKARPID